MNNQLINSSSSENVELATNESEMVRLAVKEHFEAVSNEGDTIAIEKHLRSKGFTEITTKGSLDHYSLQDLKQIFQKGIDLDMQVEEINLEVVGDGAVVTGYLLWPKKSNKGTSAKNRARISMFWSKIDGVWKLIHTHISPPEI